MQIAPLLLASLALTTPLAAQSFEPGDLYLYQPAFDGAASHDGAVVKVDLVTGNATKFLDLETSSSRRDQLAYDPFRDRLIFQGGFTPNHTELYLADAAGNVTSLGLASAAGPAAGAFAPRGDGNVYFQFSSDIFDLKRLDATNTVHLLLDASGAAPFAPSGWHTGLIQAMEYHAPTNSLLLGFGANQGICAGGQAFDTSIRQLTLSADGTRVLAETCWQFDFLPGQFDGRIVGMSAMPGGDLLVTMDAFQSGALPRMLRVDPVAQTATPFATNDYLGDGSVVAGAYNHTLAKAVIADSFHDVLRSYAAGESGAGASFAPGISASSGTGEVASLVEIGVATGGPAMSASPLTLSGSAGGTQAWQIEFGSAFGGEFYLVVGSLTGWSPGTPYAGLTVPLQPDVYTTFTINNAGGAFLPGSVGQLDANGSASASFVLPPSVAPSFVGRTGYHATLAFTSAFVPLGVTNAVRVTVQ